MLLGLYFEIFSEKYFYLLKGQIRPYEFYYKKLTGTRYNTKLS